MSYINDMEVQVDYFTIYTYQRDDEELLANRKYLVTSSNYKLEPFEKFRLWTKNSDSDGKHRIWVPHGLRAELLD